ncbi:MAG: helix-turn-helix domain-containing protein [Miltoncostaeaceae bacterium]
MLGRDYVGQNCSIARALEVVGERWTLLIVRDALRGFSRFDQFAARLNLAPSTLTTRLNRLVEEGVMERRPYQERPRRNEYLLTERGRALLPVVLSLMDWGDRFLATAGAPALASHRGCGGLISPDTSCATCGQRVEPARIEWLPGPGADEDDGASEVRPRDSEGHPAPR